MNGVLLVLIINALLGAVLMALHNYHRISWIVATIASLILGAIALLGPFETPFTLGTFALKLETTFVFLGRRLIIDGSNQYSLGYLYIAAAFLFGGGWVARPSRYFYSAGTLAVLAMTLSLMVDPFLYSAIFIEVAAFAIVFVIFDPLHPNVQPALRLLLFYSLGMMAILMAGWLLDTSGVTTGAPVLVERVLRFLAVGFGILLVVPPFHFWLPAAADSANRYSLVFAVVLLYSTGLFVLLRFINEFEWLRTSAFLSQGLLFAGVAMMMIGGLWALAQRKLTRATVFLLLVDFGATMVALSISSREGYSLALMISGSRIISTGVWAIGAAVLDRNQTEQGGIVGSAYSNPLAVAAIVVGMFSLGGLPLTAGFPGRWGSIQIAGEASSAAAFALVLALALAAATVMRWVGVALSQPDSAPATVPLSSWERFLIGSGIAMCLTLGIFPQVLFPWLSQALNGLENLIQ